ncbi:APC family permease [Gordonia rubripertincta]|uniref:APC family permease n=1 Tax=Gordonia rubripertincta TaxID=36822 RepID=A0ABT4MWU5_GORRU|nr:APC family permease [Gordonia rubripertincta]MCZ4551466.1 APC family permease [Gordonia rubripertincta]
MTASSQRLSGNLTTFKIVTMVVAAAAPMGAVIGIIPIAMAIGTGATTPLVFVVAAALLLCFAVGYAAMSRRMSASGGFYTYIAKGLGRSTAMAAAVIAITAYLSLTLLILAGVGNFGNTVAAVLTGHNVPWWVFSAVALALVAVMGVREINIAGNVLAVMLGVEILAILVLDIAIVAQKGLDAFPLAAMNPTDLFTAGSFGLGIMFAFTTFLGFESAAIYAEESKDPHRTIPRATYSAVVLIATFYAVTTWIMVGGIGVDNVQETAEAKLSGLSFWLSAEYASDLLTKVMYVTVFTSLFAAMLALHNASSRYIFSIGREGALLPTWFGVAHSKFDTPARASIAVTILTSAVTVVFAALGADPYLTMLTIMTGLGTLGIVLLQALAAGAIMVYFWRTSRSSTGVLVGSAIGLVAFVTVSILILKNFQTLAGSDSAWINVLPWCLLLAAALGGLRGVWLKSHKPDAYARIGTFGDQTAPAHEELPSTPLQK